MNRREFLLQSTSAVAALVACSPPQLRAVDAFSRPGKSRLSLGLAAYGFRDYFKDLNHNRDRQTDPAKRIDMFQFVDYCADHACAAELTSYYFPQNLDREYLLKLRRHAFLRGVPVSGTAVGNTFTHSKGEKRDREIASVKKWIDHAAVLGAPHIRVFAGDASGQPLDVAKRHCLEALEECAAYAGQNGVFLGIENHGGIVAQAGDLLDIVRDVRSPWVGVNLDTGNFHTADPYADLARCAPYAVNVQIKVEIQPRGAKRGWADLGRLVGILRQANYQGYVTLEYEASEDPWTAVPRFLEQLRPLLA